MCLAVVAVVACGVLYIDGSHVVLHFNCHRLALSALQPPPVSQSVAQSENRLLKDISRHFVDGLKNGFACC